MEYKVRSVRKGGTRVVRGLKYAARTPQNNPRHSTGDYFLFVLLLDAFRGLTFDWP